MKKNTSFTLMIISIVLIFAVGVILLGLNYLGLTFVFVGAFLVLFSFINAMVIVGTYNKIVKLKHKVVESLSLIDIQLKSRFDLVPNLVATVKGYAKHEQTLLKEVIELRNKAVNAEGEEEKLDNANKLLPKLKQTVLLAEDYPDLKADKVFKSLMDDLVDIEDRIAASRRIYDSNVSLYNSQIQVFPNNLIAKATGFKNEALFKIDTAETIVPKLDL